MFKRDDGKNYMTVPMPDLPDFKYDNVYATEDVTIFSGGCLPTRKSSRNTLTINGNLKVKNEVMIVPESFSDFGPNDLFFNGHIYVSGDVVAKLFQTYVDELTTAK